MSSATVQVRAGSAAPAASKLCRTMSPDPSDDARRDQANAWNAVSLIASGVFVWGGLGWLVSEWLDNQIFLMLGLLLGTGGALYLVWVRYGRA